MKYVCVKDCGTFQTDHVYEIGKPSQATRMAIQMGYLRAVNGWCAPSETIYQLVGELGPELVLPAITTKRGGIKFPDQAEQPEKPRKTRKKAAQPETLESIAEAASEALDGLRGPSGI